MAILWVGIGYRQGTPAMSIDRSINQVFTDFQLDLSLVRGVGTIDRKAHDPAIWQVCQDRAWQLQFFSAAALSIVPVPSSSAVVQQQVQTPTVAEGAALLATGSGGELLVPKQIYRLAGQALTIAVAQVADADKISCC
jgi:cobalt-precorrin 5A hydrolase / precorrin-3B C17-methyltransferase